MIKTKLLKILPFWLLGLVLVFVGQIGAVLLPLPLNSLLAQGPVLNQPQVLGVTTSRIRGGEVDFANKISKISEPNTSGISAKSFIIFDMLNGDVLTEKSSHQRLGIASLTKLMTGLVAYKQADLNKPFLIENKDTFSVNPVVGLVPGDEVKALDVFNAMLVGSSNDAALGISRYVSQETGRNFIELMNEEAKNLGMEESHFSNPRGFDSDYNYSTAADLKILISAAEQLAVFRNLGRRETYRFTGKLGKIYLAPATNKLLESHPDIEAIKTGFTENSGGAMATKIKVDDREVVIIILGSQDREADTLKLKDEVLKNFKVK